MNDGKPQHARLRDLQNAGNELLIGGQPVSRLAERAGQTPFFAYDRAAISARIAELRTHLPERVEIHYAIKANSMPALLGHVVEQVDGFDVASVREMRTALDAGMSPQEISFAGPGKSDAELRGAIAGGVCVNCESAGELARLASLSETLGITARVALRVNPDFELKGAGMKMSGSPKPFGIDAALIPQMITEAVQLGLDFEGLHIFCGSQNLRTDAIIEANVKTLDLARQFQDASGTEFRSLNIGGGYGIPYFPNEEAIDLAAVGSALGSTLANHGSAFASTKIIVELGRYIVGEAGYYVCRVIDIKQSQGVRFAVVDGGLHHHLANSGNFGQVLRKNYPVVIANRVGQAAEGEATIVGPLCTPLDIVADNIAVPELAVGDLVAVLQSGAYAFTASPQEFLSHPPPVQILV